MAESTQSSPFYTVCHRELTTAPENYYAAEYQGRTIYFCTSFCLEAFNADPDRFFAAHSKKKNPNAPDQTRPSMHG